ncbi:hypothetical protein FXN61_32215 [Lentzea sp. PSKA42]|uniref:Excreted virulence factor EspC, type VII ESX diderm n=1 Tax=Lentzea indica TaxID=2604800 RepID=A0ABX1FQU4_9PSEU|nr:hypothetical protein [Lentzea indica]NKE61189.1 hypothetical protein [Lentzea indica]
MGDDGLHMDTASTAAAMDRIANAGQTMTGDWRTVSAEITSLGGQLGRGDLGAAFLAGYGELAAQVASDAEQRCQVPGLLADAGNACVDSYRSADAAGAGVISAVDPSVSRLG